MALSANASYTLRNVQGAMYHSTTVKTSAVIYQHSLVVVDISAGTSKVAANETTTLFLGLATASSTGTFPVTGDGTKTVTTVTNIEVNLPAKTVVTQSNVLGSIYAFDDADVTDLTTRGPAIGIVTEYVGANDVWVWLGQSALSAAG